jgi:hypothetical protein
MDVTVSAFASLRSDLRRIESTLSARLHQIEGRLDALETAAAGVRHDLARIESALSCLNALCGAPRPADDQAIPEYTDSEYDPATGR